MAFEYSEIIQSNERKITEVETSNIFGTNESSTLIDTFFNRDNLIEVDKFQENTGKLWSFAQSKGTFNIQH